MPEKRTTDRAEKALREGKSSTTAAGEFVREEMEHVRKGKHGARSPKQAIAIGLSKARRAGVPLPRRERGGRRRRRVSRPSARMRLDRGRGRPGRRRGNGVGPPGAL
jgi:hypothetical protein